VRYTRTRNYHWSVVGPQFDDLHDFFGVRYEALAYGTLAEFVQHSHPQGAARKHNDAGTRDFPTGLMEKHGKTAWALRSYNEK